MRETGESTIEKGKAYREIAEDEVGEDKICTVQFVRLVMNFIKSRATNSMQFKDCQSRFYAPQSLPS